MKNTNALGQLIDDLLAFSHIGRQSAKYDEISMETLVKEVCESLALEHEGRAVDIKTGRMEKCYGDSTMIRQVLVNLISNALKFTRQTERTEIEIGSGEKGEEVVYYVRDNGVGFDVKYVSKLFGVFQRLHRQEDFEGTGIGLAIVKRIVSKHGGRVWAESEPGKGAAFYFSLPKKSS